MLTKLVIFLSGFSMLYAIYLHTSGRGVKKVIGGAFVGLCAFALLSEFNGALGCLIIMFVLSLMMGLGKRFWLQLWLPIFVIIILVQLAMQVKTSGGREYFNQTEPHIFTFLDAGCGQSLEEQRTPQDSMKWIAVKHWFFVDKAQITPAFLEKISCPSVFSLQSLANWRTKVSSEIAKLDYSIERNKELLFCNALAMLVMIVLMFRGKVSAFIFARFVIFQLFFWLYIFLITVFIKMEDRVLSPLLIVYSFGNLIFISQYLPKFRLSNFKKNHLTYAIGIITSAFAAYYLFALVQKRALSYAHTAGYEYEEMQYVKAAWNEINRLFEDKIIVLDQWAGVQLSLCRPFENPQFSKQNRFVFYDSGYSTFYPSFERDMEKLYGSSRFDDLYRFLYKNKEKVVFIGDKDRMKLIADYLEVLYGLKYDFKIIHPNSAITKSEASHLKPDLALNYYVFSEVHTPPQ